MRFMGIPVHRSSVNEKSSDSDLKAIVESVSQISILRLGNSSKDSRSTPQLPPKKTRKPPEAVMLEPKVPEFDYTDDVRERSRVDKFAPFAKAQPRGTNSKNLRVDKSLPWIQDDLDATRAKIKDKAAERKSFANGNPELEVEIKRKEKNPIQSAMKESFIEVIATKLLTYKAQDDSEEPKCEDTIGGEIQSAVESKSESSLSSAGTYFTNDSGSFLVLDDRKIPKSEMNIQKKFQVS